MLIYYRLKTHLLLLIET